MKANIKSKIDSLIRREKQEVEKYATIADYLQYMYLNEVYNISFYFTEEEIKNILPMSWGIYELWQEYKISLKEYLKINKH